MSGSKWTFNDDDRKLAEALRSFLPDRVFDFHAHIYRLTDLNVSSDSSGLWGEGPEEVSVDVGSGMCPNCWAGSGSQAACFFPCRLRPRTSAPKTIS